MHEVLVNRLGGLSLPRKSVVRLTDRPDMTLDVYRGRKTTIQHLKQKHHQGYVLKRYDFQIQKHTLPSLRLSSHQYIHVDILQKFCFKTYGLDIDCLFVFRSNIILGFFRHHGGIFVIRCCSIFLD